MARALCQACGREQQWNASRGARLADLRCACGGMLQRAAYRRLRTNAGQTYGRCAHCGHKKLHRSMVQVRWPWRMLDGTHLEIGTWVCRSHSICCPAWDDGDEHTWMRVDAAERGERCTDCYRRAEPSEAEREGMDGIEAYSDAEYNGL